MWILIILLHEIGHILQGHLNLLINKQLINYYDGDPSIESRDVNEELNESKKDIWIAVETEADTYATQSAFGLLPQIDVISNFLLKEGINCKENVTNIFSIYGDSLCLFYNFYYALYSSSDLRHPHPCIRMYICATSFNEYCQLKIKEKNEQQEQFRLITKEILNSYEEINTTFNIKHDECEIFNAIKLCEKIPSIIKNDDFVKFRLKK